MNTTSDTPDLPRLELRTTDQIDQAVTHAFWTLRALVRGFEGAAPDELSEAERARRRALMQDLAQRLGASVCTPPPGAPLRGQRRGR